MEKFGFIYLWFDKKHKRYYVGSHWGTETDGYVCSSNWMRESYKRRPTDFRRRIITKIFTDRMDLLKEEQKYIDLIKPGEFGTKYYNINSKVNKYCWWMNEETKKIVGSKISEKNSNNPNWGSWSKNKLVSEKTRKKQSLTHLGQTTYRKGKKLEELHDPTTVKLWKQRMSKSRKGKPPSNKGLPRSKESKEKISIGLKKYQEKHGSHWVGRKHKPESIEKMRKKAIGRIPWNKGLTLKK